MAGVSSYTLAIVACLVFTFMQHEVTAAYSGNCNSPHGNDCTWYRECLEAKIPCSGRTGDYAIAYGNKFCELYRQAYGSFSSQGKRWIDAVRKCLQVKLAPKLTASPRPTCPALKQFAFDTHVPCYVNPGNGAPSYCSLSLSDHARIISTISSSIFSDLWATISAGLRTLGNCIG